MNSRIGRLTALKHWTVVFRPPWRGERVTLDKARDPVDWAGEAVAAYPWATKNTQLGDEQ